ncbi:MAG: hypothetical protein MAG795_00508 [Candidatus Woesearchaeota archaeon]|nr:hypothetical protein [Candidatus Woesearchaeota archaeon]
MQDYTLTPEFGEPDLAYDLESILDIDALKQKPSDLIPLKQATDYFRAGYLLAMSTTITPPNKHTIYHLSGVVDYNRPGLSKLVNELGIKNAIGEIQDYDITSVLDPVAKETVKESIIYGKDLKQATGQFKARYVTFVYEETNNIQETATILECTLQTVRNQLENYKQLSQDISVNVLSMPNL